MPLRSVFGINLSLVISKLTLCHTKSGQMKGLPYGATGVRDQATLLVDVLLHLAVWCAVALTSKILALLLRLLVPIAGVPMWLVPGIVPCTERPSLSEVSCGRVLPLSRRVGKSWHPESRQLLLHRLLGVNSCTPKNLVSLRSPLLHLPCFVNSK